MNGCYCTVNLKQVISGWLEARSLFVFPEQGNFIIIETTACGRTCLVIVNGIIGINECSLQMRIKLDNIVLFN